MSTEFVFKNVRFECLDKQRYSIDALSATLPTGVAAKNMCGLWSIVASACRQDCTLNLGISLVKDRNKIEER